MSIPQVPHPVAYIQSNKQSGHGDVTAGLDDHSLYPRSVPTKIPYLEKRLSDPPGRRPLILLNNLPPKPININLIDDMTRFYAEVEL